jgi:hypothetical protein
MSRARFTTSNEPIDAGQVKSFEPPSKGSALMKRASLSNLRPMLYIIGGLPRCGKSELARRLTARSALSFVSTDLLWAVLAKGAEQDWFGCKNV